LGLKREIAFMSMKETLNKKPALAAGISAGLIVVAALILYLTLRTGRHTAPTKAFYTLDDGQTLFTDVIDRATPFTVDGKEAVRAYVYTCDAGKTQFVAYLEKGTQPAPKVEEAERPKPAANEAEARQAAALAAQKRAAAVIPFTAVLKRPGDKEWSKPGSKDYFTILSPKCPQGGVLDRVAP
jgi:hypothetical protein